MGMVYTEVTLKNVKDIGLAQEGYIKEQAIREDTVTALVDTGAMNLCITEEIFDRLGLEIVEQKTATVANGQRILCNVTGPVEVHWKDRRTVVMATVVPGADKVLLGAIPLEGMDLMVNPSQQEVVGVHGDEMLLLI